MVNISLYKDESLGGATLLYARIGGLERPVLLTLQLSPFDATIIIIYTFREQHKQDRVSKIILFLHKNFSKIKIFPFWMIDHQRIRCRFPFYRHFNYLSHWSD